MDNVKSTIIVQYAKAMELIGLVESMNLRISPDADIAAFYDDVYNLATAGTYGLDVWGRRLGISRVVEFQGLPDRIFGFAGSEREPFGQGVFYSGLVTNYYRLENEPYRTLLYLKAAANITDCSIPSLNALLQFYFRGRGPCYILDLVGMHMRFVFEFPLEDYELGILSNPHTFPTPSGVGYDIVIYNPATTFGFAGSGLHPFNQGIFFEGVRNAFK